MLDTYGRKYVQPLIEVIANFFIKLKFSANQVTILSFVVGILSGSFLLFGFNITALILLWISGLLDAVDGTVARLTNNSTLVGTLLDIVFDRIIEVLIILVLSFRYVDSRAVSIFLMGSIIISMTVFLTVGSLSSKKSKKSFYYQAGIAERTEGFIFFSLAMIFPNYIIYILSTLTFLIIITASQRFFEGIRILR